MVKYIALENIGDFKKGDVVPAEKAELWNSMYGKKPCMLEEVEEVAVVVPKKAPAPVVVEEKKPDVKKKKFTLR